jgi:hypothetical protein
MCGRMNPADNVFCDSCGARLVPATPASAQESKPVPTRSPADSTVIKKGLSLPTKPREEPPALPSSEAPGDSDDWLSRLRGAMPEQPAPDENAPDWLRGREAESAKPVDQEPAIDLAARLGSAEPTPALDESSQVPDWSAQFAPKKPAVPAPAPSELAEAPDWLKELAPTAKAPPSPTAPTPIAPAPPQANVPDWLKELAPTQGATAAAAEPVEPEPADVPDWLKQFAPAAKAPSSPVERVPREAPPKPPAAPVPAEGQAPDRLEPSAPAVKSDAGEGEVPDWLKEFAPPSAAPAAPSEEPPKAETPDWLAQLEPTPTTPSTPAVSWTGEADVPDWLKQPLPGEASEAPPPALEPSAFAGPAPTEAGIPDWLSQLETAPTAEPVEGAPLAVEPETPDWLQSLPAAAPSATGPTFADAGVPEPTETPLWLADVKAPSVEPVEPAPPPAWAELPDWLRDLEEPAAVSEPEMTPSAPAPFKEPVALPSEAVPDWLKELKPAKTGAPAPPPLTGPTVPLEAGGLAAAQLPSWLKELQPTGAPAKEEKEEPVETEGILEGVHGALPAAAIVSQALGAVVTAHSMLPEIPAHDLARAGALQELLARGTAAVVRRAGASRAQRLWGNTQRWIVFIVIAVLAVFPLVQPDSVIGLVGAPLLNQVGEDLFNNIQALQPGASVLMAFDYDATQSPEMDAQASVLLRHLAARKANIKVTSLYPAGPAVAQAVINQVNSTLTGTLPIKIEMRGYLPGQDTAVAYFVQGTPISMVVELAATPDSVRWWAEQLAARPDAPTLLAGVSASAEPMSQPYVESHQVSGMISGIPGATAYRLKLRQILQDDSEMAQVLAPLASIGLANAALAALIVLGGLIQLVSGRKPQPATRSGGRQRE